MIKPLASFHTLNCLYFFLPCTFDFILSCFVSGTTVIFNIRPVIFFFYFNQSVCPTALLCKPLTLYTTFNPSFIQFSYCYTEVTCIIQYLCYSIYEFK